MGFWEELHVPGLRFNIVAVADKPKGVRITMKQPDLALFLKPQAWVQALVRYNGYEYVPQDRVFPHYEGHQQRQLMEISYLSHKVSLTTSLWRSNN